MDSILNNHELSINNIDMLIKANTNNVLSLKAKNE